MAKGGHRTLASLLAGRVGRLAELLHGASGRVSVAPRVQEGWKGENTVPTTVTTWTLIQSHSAVRWGQRRVALRDHGLRGWGGAPSVLSAALRDPPFY